MSKTSIQDHAAIPMRSVGPVEVKGPVVQGAFRIPLATFESPLWPSTERGARVTARAGGIAVVVADACMTRSVMLKAADAARAVEVTHQLAAQRAEMEAVAASSSRFCRLRDWQTQVVGNMIFVRFACHTGDAAGHNMVTHAADRLLSWLLEQYPDLTYGSISGNYCTDKKVSAVNGILGRGTYVVADTLIPGALCARFLKTTPARLVELNWRKNWMGGALAGSVRSANAHFANMLLAFYLATGQDAANIVEGSQGFTHTETRGDDLYFSVTLPNVIVGSVGNGKGLDFVQRNLEQLDCLAEREPGANARRLAALAGATVLCGELSLLAAQTNPGELMRAHLSLERP
jgi:hydroxymethylglutaryl-CoA reductase (NADPH)